jgi:hypothetical protein
MCSTVFNEWFFTPEGDRIPRDTQPTYWAFPESDDAEKTRDFWDGVKSIVENWQNKSREDE